MNRKSFNSTQKISVLVFLFLLVSLPLAIIAVLNPTKIFKRAAEPETNLANNLLQQSKYKEGEVLVKLKNSNQESIALSDFKKQGVPTIFKTIDQKYKINNIERVFKVALKPAEEISKFKQKFPDRKIDEKKLLEIDLSKIYKLSFDKNADIEQIVSLLASDPEIEYAEPNYIYQGQIVPNDPYYFDHYPDNVSNRDPVWNPSYDYQWNLKKINLEQAWNITTGNSDIKVAVIDTGVDCTHQELAGACLPGYDFVNSDDDPTDDGGHGTHVAGIISSLSNNDIGVSGISWQSKIVPVKGLSSNGSGDDTVLANSIVYASDQGVQIINMSWGNSTPIYNIPQILKDALDYAYNHNVVLIASAGNSNDRVENGYWPEYYPIE